MKQRVVLKSGISSTMFYAIVDESCFNIYDFFSNPQNKEKLEGWGKDIEEIDEISIYKLYTETASKGYNLKSKKVKVLYKKGGNE